MTARQVDPEGRQAGVDRPFVGENRSAPLGHQATLTTDRFLAPRWDVQHCLNCGGKLTIIAVILESAVIERILTHLGLRARAPPQAPARGQARQAA